ncbi:MAG: hypothetical protein HOP10_01560 [Chitinophagaceae bacterium]|nr:hypothetical protein [Chitinophagaceae bacterium]
MSTAQSPLTNLGFNMVAWPKTGIQPLALLYKTDKGVSAVESDVEELFKPGDATIPRIKSGIATDIKGAAGLTFDAKGGISMLDWLLNKLHLGKMNANVNLNNSYEVTVSYLNVREDKISLLSLDNFITTAKPDLNGFNTFKDKLQNNELYVINAVAKSNDISVTIADKNGQDVSLDATVKGIMGINMSAARKQNNAIELVYKTSEDEPLVFAFKAQRIIYDAPGFWSGGPGSFRIKDQVGAVLMGPEDLPTKPLQTGSDLVEI